MDGSEGSGLRVARLPASSDRNPYQRLLYDHLAREGVELVGQGSLVPDWLEQHRDEVDLLHVHWRLDRLVDDDEPLGPPRLWTSATAAAATQQLGVRLRHARALGYTLAWTVHEIAQLGGSEPTLEHLAAGEVGRHAHVVLTHNQVSTARVVDLGLAPADRVHTIPLGHYGHAHGAARAGVARAALGIGPDAIVFLAFGHQRSDKALDLLHTAFARLDRSGAVLVIGGTEGDQRTADGSAAPVADWSPDRRTVRLGHIPDDWIVGLHELADATVVARGYEWTPSSLVLSLSHGCPVVAADLASVAEHGGPGVFPFHPGDATDLAATLARVADDPQERRIRGAAGRAFVRGTTWDDTASATAAAFRAGRTQAQRAPAPAAAPA